MKRFLSIIIVIAVFSDQSQLRASWAPKQPLSDEENAYMQGLFDAVQHNVEHPEVTAENKHYSGKELSNRLRKQAEDAEKNSSFKGFKIKKSMRKSYMDAYEFMLRGAIERSDKTNKDK